MNQPLFVDPVVGLKHLLDARLPDLVEGTVNVGDWPGPGLRDSLTYVAIELVDGEASYTRGDYLVSVDVFGPSRARARSVAQAIQGLLLGYPGGVAVPEGGWFQPDEVSCTQFPRREDWEDDAIRRQSAMYSISARR